MLADEEIECWLDRGFDFVMAGLDASYVVEGNRRAKSTFEAAVAECER